MKELEKKLLGSAGPKSGKVLEKFFNYSARTTVDSPFVPAKAKGVKIQSVDGEWFLDFTSGVGVSNLGYKTERIYRAIKRQMRSGLTQFLYHDWANDPAATLCQLLAALAPGDFPKKVFLCSTGTEANEAALKLAFAKRPERKRVIAFEGAFHGRTLGIVPLMGSKAIHSAGYPLAYPVHHFPFPAKGTNWRENCLEAMKRQFKKFIPPQEVNMMIMELVQGEGGIIPADPKAVRALVDLCREHDILFAVDEVQTGMARTGKMFASECYGVAPDIITLAKALGSGVVPIGATVFRADLDWSENGRHSSTNGGNLLAAAAALETIHVMTSGNFLENVKERGKKLEKHMRSLKTQFYAIKDVRGLGMMWGVEFTNKSLREAVVRECYNRKLMVIGAGESAIRIMPPLIITAEEMSNGIEILEDSIGALAR